MRKVGKKSVVVAALVGALMAAVAPGAAQAATPPKPQPSALTSSSLAALAGTPIRLQNQKSFKYLTPSGFSTGTVGIVQEALSSSAVQKWLIGADGSWSFFANAGTSPYKCIGVSGASTSPGAQALQAACGPDLNQEWDVHWRTNQVFELRNRKKTTMCLGINGASTNPHAAAMIFNCDGSLNQGWSAIPA